ncbi:MAG TPA: HD domain-containing phosphohydrolase [Candidatus Aquicultor sp.]|jgi:putative nucleotidyltransferase with HDIG domain
MKNAFRYMGTQRLFIGIGLLGFLLTLMMCGIAAWAVSNGTALDTSKAIVGFVVVAALNVCEFILLSTFVRKTHEPLFKISKSIEHINPFDLTENLINEFETRAEELELLTDINVAIHSGYDVSTVFDLISERMAALINADYCCVALLNKDELIEIKSLRGFDRAGKLHLFANLKGETVNPGFCPAITTGEIICLEDLEKSELTGDAREMYERLGAHSMLAAPLMSEGKPIGSTVVWYKAKRTFSNMEIKRVKLFAGQISVLIRSASLLDGYRSLALESIRALANAIDARDAYTAHHSGRVSMLAVALAQEAGLSQEEVQTIEYAGLLHDIGKIGINEGVLNKPGRLTEEEMEIMKSHPVMSVEIIEPIEFLKDILPIVRHHHEWFNGGGYPDGLAGEDIPLSARILAVADALEAMTSSRVYRQEMPLIEGAKRLSAGSGIQFDPQIVELMLKVVQRIESIAAFDQAQEVYDTLESDSKAS